MKNQDSNPGKILKLENRVQSKKVDRWDSNLRCHKNYDFLHNAFNHSATKTDASNPKGKMIFKFVSGGEQKIF